MQHSFFLHTQFLLGNRITQGLTAQKRFEVKFENWNKSLIRELKQCAVSLNIKNNLAVSNLPPCQLAVHQKQRHLLPYLFWMRRRQISNRVSNSRFQAWLYGIRTFLSSRKNSKNLNFSTVLSGKIQIFEIFAGWWERNLSLFLLSGAN